MNSNSYHPLDGVRILDMATMVAAPLGATLCGDLGAEVVKLELPSGADALRSLAPVVNGLPIWWKVANRGKLGMSLDVRKEEGRGLFLKLLPNFDVLVENFRTGTMDSWGLDADTLFNANPRLVIIRLTGFGQSGPYANRPGYARVFEAMSSFTSLTRSDDGMPQHADHPVGDAVAAVFVAFSIAAEIARLRADSAATGREIDLAASEALLRLLDPIPAEYALTGRTRRPKGSAASYTAPSNIFISSDGIYFTMPASSDEMFRRLCEVADRKDWLKDSRFRTSDARLRNSSAINEAVAEIFANLQFSQISEKLERGQIPFSKVNEIADAIADPHFIARNAFVDIDDPDFGKLPSICVVPRATGYHSPVPRSGPSVGQDNEHVYSKIGLTTKDLDALKARGIV